MGDNGFDYGGDIPAFGTPSDYDTSGTSTDVPGQSTSDPYNAGPDNSPAPDAYPADMPDTGAAGLPGSSMIPSLPTGVQQSQLTSFFNAGGPYGLSAGSGNLPNLGTSPSVSANPGYTIQPVGPGGSGLVTAGTIAMLLKAVAARIGVRVTVGAIVQLIGKYGLAAASNFTGLAPNVLVGLWMRKHKRRRRRGITGRQLANAARVARTLYRMQQTFRAALPSGYGGGHSHRRALPAFHRRRRR